MIMGDHEGAGGSGGKDTALNILTKFDLSSLLRLNRTQGPYVRRWTMTTTSRINVYIHLLVCERKKILKSPIDKISSWTHFYD